jgi:lysophospholipase L1-like esterase
MKIRKTVAFIALGAAFLLVLGTCATTAPEAPESDVETWDYVVLGNSVGAWWAEDYGDLVESDLGVKLVYRNHWAPGQMVWELLRDIRVDETLQADIKEAELITIGVGCSDMFWEIESYVDSGLVNQGGMSKKLERFRETYDTMLTELLAFTSPTDTIIRTMDFYYPYVRRDQERGIYDETKRWWHQFNECIVDTARKHGIPAARVFEAYNGPDGNDDPREKGYLYPDDRHSSDEGMKVIAREFQKLGYQHASP